MKKSQKPKLWWRTRGLEKMESRFGNKRIESFVRERLKSGKKVRLLEFGFGEGRCLLDLRQMFPTSKLELFGVNRNKQGNMHSRADFAKNAKLFGLSIPRKELLPKPYFYDCGKGLKFQSNYFDLIISQVAFQYVDDKAKLIEEFWRVLKPEGKAFLNIDSYEEYYPDFMQINKETPRLIIYNKSKIVKFSKIVRICQKKGYDLKFVKKKTLRHLLIAKNKIRRLKLGLKYEDDYSFDLTKHNAEKSIEGVWWGYRSIFKV